MLSGYHRLQSEAVKRVSSALDPSSGRAARKARSFARCLSCLSYSCLSKLSSGPDSHEALYEIGYLHALRPEAANVIKETAEPVALPAPEALSQRRYCRG